MYENHFLCQFAPNRKILGQWGQQYMNSPIPKPKTPRYKTSLFNCHYIYNVSKSAGVALSRVRGQLVFNDMEHLDHWVQYMEITSFDTMKEIKISLKN